MKLLMSPTSPYARIVRAVLIEKSSADQVEMVQTDPWESGAPLLSANPFSRIPVLVTDSGIELSESLLIATYLEQKYPDPALVPEKRSEQVLHKAALGIGLVDSTIAIVAGRKFDSNADSNELVQRRHAALGRALPVIAEVPQKNVDEPDLGDLVIAVALGYLGFRLPDMNWRDTHAELGDWLERISARRSMTQTAPPS